MLTAALLALAACSGSIKSAEIDVAPPGAALTEPCSPPVALPDRALTQAEVEVRWARDRVDLLDCGKRHAALADHAGRLGAALSGEGAQ